MATQKAVRSVERCGGGMLWVRGSVLGQRNPVLFPRVIFHLDHRWQTAASRLNPEEAFVCLACCAFLQLPAFKNRKF